MKTYEYSFKHYADTILPSRMEMLTSLIDHAFNVNDLFGKGSGERGVIKKIGRISDFKGIYAFADKKQIVYIGTSEKVINRLAYQIKGHTKYQAHVAWEVAKARGLYINKKLGIHDLNAAKKILMKMQVLFMEVTSPVERHLLEVYAAMHFGCKFNYFESR